MSEQSAHEDSTNETLDIIFQQVKQQLTMQWSSIDTVDTKAGIVVAAVAVVVAAVLANGLCAATLGQRICAVLLLLATFAAVFCAIISFVRKIWNEPPEPGPLYRKYLSASSTYLKKTLILTWIRAFEDNKSLLMKKLFWFRLSLLMLTLAIIFAIAYQAFSM